MVDIPDTVRNHVQDEWGEDELTILEHLVDEGPTTDTVLAEQLDTKTSTIRKALYRLYEDRIADYRENRDEEKGWLTFVWSYTPDQAKRELAEARQEAADEIREEIQELKQNELFACPRGHVQLEFARAMDLEFHCPECGVEVDPVDEEQRIQQLQEQLESIEEGTA